MIRKKNPVTHGSIHCNCFLQAAELGFPLLGTERMGRSRQRLCHLHVLSSTLKLFFEDLEKLFSSTMESSMLTSLRLCVCVIYMFNRRRKTKQVKVIVHVLN